MLCLVFHSIQVTTRLEQPGKATVVRECEKVRKKLRQRCQLPTVKPALTEMVYFTEDGLVRIQYLYLICIRGILKSMNVRQPHWTSQ